MADEMHITKRNLKESRFTGFTFMRSSDILVCGG